MRPKQSYTFVGAAFLVDAMWYRLYGNKSIIFDWNTVRKSFTHGHNIGHGIQSFELLLTMTRNYERDLATIQYRHDDVETCARLATCKC